MPLDNRGELWYHVGVGKHLQQSSSPESGIVYRKERPIFVSRPVRRAGVFSFLYALPTWRPTYSQGLVFFVTLSKRRRMERKVIKICTRLKMVGDTHFDNELGLLCMQNFFTLEKAQAFVNDNPRITKLLFDGSHCPHDPDYLRWSEFRIVYVAVSRQDAPHITAINQRHELIQSSNAFRTAFSIRPPTKARGVFFVTKKERYAVHSTTN